MKRIFTIAACAFVLIPVIAQAQPVRNGEDVIWARDINGAEMTLDGVLDEAVWQQAEAIPLNWGQDHPAPGAGQFTDGTFTPTEPTDPPQGTVYVLRDGNTLWLGAEVQDQSIGGSRGLWGVDGLIMNILDRERFIAARPDQSNFFQGNRTEFFISWWNGADTTNAESTYDDGELVGSGRPLPGIGPRMHGYYGGQPDLSTERPDSLVAIWDSRTTVNGIPNDDTHGDDEGYVIEMRLDLSELGYDFTQAGGDRMAWNVALRDVDYDFPHDADLNYRSVVYWQNPWGNNFNEGVAYLHGAPGVTVDGDVPEVTEPEFTIENAERFDHPEIDGALDEDVWDRVDPSFYVQYQPEQSLLDMNPEVARYYMFYFRPDINNDGNAALVVDPSVARFKMFFKDDMLYVGVDVDDQAISGTSAESGMDGIYLFLRDRDSLTTQGSLWTRRFDFSVDSTGAIRYGSDAATMNDEDPTSVNAAVHLKGSSTAGDASDVDEGYQLEIAIDLTKALGYPEGLGDRKLWTAMNFLDGDFLESEEDSYAMRTWVITERGGGSGASIYGYLDPNAIIGTSTGNPSELPTEITLMGNYPNPFNPSTTLKYALPYSGEVSIQVFDVIGRRVMDFVPGIQSAGANETRFDASSLASGIYLYRVQVRDLASGASRASAVGRMTLIK